jgi:precorrin-6B methylase 1
MDRDLILTPNHCTIVIIHGEPHNYAYDRMVERILSYVRRGLNVCVVFYGHPGVFVHPGHESIRRARIEGFSACILPGISAEDCLFAELGIDPSKNGQSFEATENENLIIGLL